MEKDFIFNYARKILIKFFPKVLMVGGGLKKVPSRRQHLPNFLPHFGF